jgi:hypothetical protein
MRIFLLALLILGNVNCVAAVVESEEASDYYSNKPTETVKHEIRSGEEDFEGCQKSFETIVVEGSRGQRFLIQIPVPCSDDDWNRSEPIENPIEEQLSGEAQL